MSSITTRPIEAMPARRVQRSLIAGTLALLTLFVLALAPPASAASYTAGDFSAAVNPNVRVFTVDNCTAEVGIVFDWTPYPSYAHVGGVRVNCSTRHSVIEATVALYYYNGTRWVQYGSSNRGVRYSSTGSGSGILYTPRYCVGSLRYNSWMVGATVRTERTGLTNYSIPVRASDGSGC
jgi:hypothetical protein